MRTEDLIEEINLIAEAGDAEDALDLARQLIRARNVSLSMSIRRAVSGGDVNRNALRVLGEDLVRQHAASAAQYTPEVIDQLWAMDAALRASLREAATTPATERRAQSAKAWTASQRQGERIAVYNAAVDKVNQERGRVRNERAAAVVRAKTCTACFEVPAANGTCAC